VNQEISPQLFQSKNWPIKVLNFVDQSITITENENNQLGSLITFSTIEQSERNKPTKGEL
jgi:hypothetical protein